MPGRAAGRPPSRARDKFFSADEAKDFGLVDEVFERRPLPTENEAAVKAA